MQLSSLKKARTPSFDPFFLADSQKGRLARQYIQPFLQSGAEIIAFYPDAAEHKELLAQLRASFRLSEEQAGFGLTLRAALSDMWLKILRLLPEEGENTAYRQVNSRLKQMLNYIHSHYGEPIRIEEVAAAGAASERDCFRIFQTLLHCTPNAYIIGYRLQKVCVLLRESDISITEAAHSCGFGSSSHFGRFFARRYGCTPGQYRRSWQDQEKTGHK